MARPNLARFAAKAQKRWGPKAKERYAKLKLFPNRAVRRALARTRPIRNAKERAADYGDRIRAARAGRLKMRVAGGYPGAIVLNARGKSMGPSGKETPEARRVRRAHGIGMARPRVADPPRDR